jgi:hypothetical protein
MTEEKAAPTKLHWPAWVWIVGNLIVAAILIFHTVTEASRAIEQGYRVTFLVFLEVNMFELPHILLLIASSITMPFKRKVGWILALVTLAEVLIGHSITLIRDLSRGEFITRLPGISENVYLIVAATLVAMFGIPIVWLIYFIKARRRYGVVS